MALTSVYYDGPVTETDRAKNLAGAPEYGVYGPEDFRVTAHPSIPYAVLVKAGRAHGHGVTDTAAADQVVQCATLASGTRWDLIVVRRNWQPALGGPSTLEVVQSGAAAAIPAGRKVGPGVEDDQPLFLVKWQGGISAPVEFIDLRVWAGNGGMYAKDDLVRTYLTTVGTQVTINGAEWTLQLGLNDVAGWVRTTTTKVVPGASSQVGAALPATAFTTGGLTPIILPGSVEVTTDVEGGYFSIDYPQPFPNGVLAFIPINGDSAQGRDLIISAAGAPFTQTKATGFGSVVNSAGVPQLGKKYRINYVAVGW